jgi:hypothetical protein
MLNVEGPVTIYTDTRKALRRLRIRCLCLAPVFLLMFVLFSTGPFTLGGANLLRWILLAEIPVLYFLVSRNLTKQTKPIVSFSSSGITVNTLGSQIGFLRWDEIKEIYTYNLMYRFVGIELKDPKTVYARLGLKGSWLLRLNDLVIPLYKLFRIRVAPINIPQEYLPMSADELLTQIEACRSTYSYHIRP